MPALSPDQWRALSPYLDKALEISPKERTAWLNLLRAENPTLAADLQTLLKEHDALGDEGFLKTGAAALPTPAPLIGQTVGAYTLESPIGQGGMGTVWLARRSDGRFEGRAAVKFLNVGLLGGRAEERFKREGSILARLTQPNIAHLIDAGVSPNGQPYLILEYVQGKEIDAYCNEHALDVEARIRLFLDVLAAVAHAHANLIVHRDLKPSNVLVTDEGQVKLLDFGIAKLLEDEAAAAPTVLTRQGERALTLAYAAPEQVTGNPVTTGTDVYALGILLYLLLTGKHPAESVLQSPADLIKAIVDTDPARPSHITDSSDKQKRELRGDLDTIVAKALKKNPQDRYTSVTVLADDLRRYLRHQPISARADTLTYRLKKFVRRNYLAVVLASVALVAAGAGLVGTLIQAHRAASAAERARLDAMSATAVKDFLVGIFNASSKSQPDPMRAQAVTARELLDRGAERLLADRALDPEVALALLSTLGDLYLDLGLDEKRVELGRKRVELARTALPRDDLRLASALVECAFALYATDQSKDALPLLEEAERILDAKADHTSLIRARAEMALAEYWRSSDLGRSRNYAMKAVEICRRHHPNDQRLIHALRVAASTEYFANHTEASIELSREAVEIHRRLGAPEIELIQPLTGLAEQESSLSRFADAERDFKESLALSLRLSGEDHVDTIQTRMRYGRFLRTLWRLRESEQLLRQAAETAVRLLGPAESFHVPTARFELARTLAEVGKIEEAESLYREAIATRERTRPNTYQHANMLQAAALLQLLMGRYQLADQMLSQHKSINQHIGREDAGSTALLRARYELTVGEPSRALSTLPPATFADGGAVRSLDADVVRARALLDLGRANEAERLASTSLRRLSATPGTEAFGFNKADLLRSNGLALTRLGRADEAVAPLREALAWCEANLDENSPVLAESLIALAECHLLQGERAQARSLIERAQRIHRIHPNLGEHLRSPLHKIEERLFALGRR